MRLLFYRISKLCYIYVYIYFKHYILFNKLNVMDAFSIDAFDILDAVLLPLLTIKREKNVLALKRKKLNFLKRKARGDIGLRRDENLYYNGF